MLLANRKAHLPVPQLRTQLQAAVVADLAVAAAAVDMKAVVVLVVDIKVVAAAADGTNP
jgi:hypothetical protein